MPVDPWKRWPANCASLPAASTVGWNATAPTPAWTSSAANPAKAVPCVGMNGWRHSCRRCWPAARGTLATWPPVGPSRSCSRCWPRAGPTSPPSPRTRSDGDCTSAATSGSASVTCWPPTRSERKKRQLRRQIQALADRTALLVQDETELLLLPPLRAGWARRGQPAPVPISGQNARRTVFGSLHLRTGHALFLAQAHKRAENFQAFLELIHRHYRAWPVALLLGPNACHP